MPGEISMTDAFYINLDRVPERRTYIESHFKDRGVANVVRLSATDAKDPAAFKTSRFRPGLGGRWDMADSAIACFESHRRVWQEIAERDLPAAVVFEDDVVLSENAMEVIEQIANRAISFDVVKIDYSPKNLRFGPEQAINHVALRPILQTASSAGGYVVSRSGCQKLLEWSEEFGDHLDDFVFSPRSDWRLLQAFPAVAIQLVLMEGDADGIAEDKFELSERSSDPTINKAPDKGPVGFRLKKEALRGFRKGYWSLFGDARLTQKGGYIGEIPLARDLQSNPDVNIKEVSL
jgi:GR25 family glycosyltransferase involved in LPS biosynthesis